MLTAPADPTEARERFRAGTRVPTAGWAPGYAQANMIIVPKGYAYETLLFGQRNPKPCPIIDVTDAGSPHTELASDADLRTDLPAYRVWRDGELVDEPTDVTDYWADDLVTFLIGCSFTFETPRGHRDTAYHRGQQRADVPDEPSLPSRRPVERADGRVDAADRRGAGGRRDPHQRPLPRGARCSGACR
jgi:uncharacterized protein YcsI (UPF0317 family)